MNKFNRRDDYLAAALLEAVVDEDWSNVQILIQKHRAPGTRLVHSRGIAAIHFACGMEEYGFAKQVIELILGASDADVNVRTEDGEIPLHIATFWGRTDIVKVLLQHGASIEMFDDEKNTAITLAIQGEHFHLLDLFKRHAYDQKMARRKQITAAAKCIETLELPFDKSTSLSSNGRLTPKRIPYNFDATSPFYINITHRGKRMERLSNMQMAKSVNLFQLTQDNLHEFTRKQSEDDPVDKDSRIDKWRRKVDPIRDSIQSYRRESLLPEDIEDLDDLVDTFLHSSRIGNPDDEVADQVEAIIEIESTSSEEEEPTRDISNFIKSPRPNGEFLYQMTERYLHHDPSLGIAVYENKVRPHTQTQQQQHFDPDDEDNIDAETSVVSTEVTIPLEYDTDDLRAELTQFGAPPGPILKTTKKLYMKKLMKFKRNANRGHRVEGQAMPEFSFELTRAMLPDTWRTKLTEYAAHIAGLTESFRLQKTERQALREGHLKTSFVYLLIDPRVAENLVGNSKQASLTTWVTFIRSIFYVGKGKNSRPFAHLYDAIKVYGKKTGNEADSQAPSDSQESSSAKSKRRFFRGPARKAGSQSDPIEVSEKIQRIIDIWATGKGVICLQVFRNIIPSEAFTREAAIIDAIGLPNLTNVKGGDYYGGVRGWRLRDRKQLGVALLHNALLVMLADGESQLRPDDLF